MVSGFLHGPEPGGKAATPWPKRPAPGQMKPIRFWGKGLSRKASPPRPAARSRTPREPYLLRRTCGLVPSIWTLATFHVGATRKQPYGLVRRHSGDGWSPLLEPSPSFPLSLSTAYCLTCFISSRAWGGPAHFFRWRNLFGPPLVRFFLVCSLLHEDSN